MANLYGPMQFRPNPSGLSLNSRPNPQQFVAPTPAAPSAPQQLGPMPSYHQWARDKGIRIPGPLSTDRGSRTIRRDGSVRRQYAADMREMGYDYRPLRSLMQGDLAGAIRGPQSGTAPAVSGVLSLDPVAQAYMQFLNGGG